MSVNSFYLTIHVILQPETIMSDYKTIKMGTKSGITPFLDTRFSKGGKDDVTQKLWVYDNENDSPELKGCITQDWFGVHTHVGYTINGVEVLKYKTWEDFCNLSEADSKVWVERYRKTVGLFRLRHLLQLPKNITDLIELKDIGLDARNALSTALVAKELAYNFNKPGNSIYSHIILNDKWVSELIFIELAANGEVSALSPKYIRELTGYVPVRKAVIQRGYSLEKNKLKTIDWRDIHTVLSGLGLAATLTERHPFLGSFIVVDKTNSKKSIAVSNPNNKGVSASPVKLFDKLPNLDDFLGQCSLINAWADKCPVHDDIIDAEDYIQARLDTEQNSRNNYRSTNPIHMDVSNKLWDANRFYELNTVLAAPSQLAFIAELMENAVLRFEPRALSNYDDTYITNPLRSASYAVKRDTKVRLCLRINPVVENLILIANVALLDDFKNYSTAIKLKLREYLKTDENLETFMLAVKSYHKISKCIEVAAELLGKYNNGMLQTSTIEVVESLLVDIQKDISEPDTSLSPLQLVGGINLKAIEYNPDF